MFAHPATPSFLLAMFAIILVSADTPDADTRAKFEPPDGVTYHGVCLPGYWTEEDFSKPLEAYEAAVPEKSIALYSMFAHSMEDGHWNTWRFTESTPDGKWGNGVGVNLERVRDRGFVPVVAWTWMDWHKMESSPGLKDVPSGKYDWYFDDWIAGLKELKSPVFIRLSHEMDGDWYPYSEGYKPDPDRNTTADFIAYWRHIVDRFRKAGVDNVAWVWCVNGDQSGGKDWADYYPGDEYVDWLGVDVYSARNPRFIINQFMDSFGKTGKPIIFPEYGTSEEVTQWNKEFAGNAQWTAELFDVIEATPQIKAICWFEWDKSWSLTRDAAQLAEFRKRIAAKRYAGKFIADDASSEQR